MEGELVTTGTMWHQAGPTQREDGAECCHTLRLLPFSEGLHTK
jgi:hypothetical protein